MDAHDHHDGDHHHHHAPGAGHGTVKDPVCGMDVDPATAAGKLEHGGQSYFFCSRHCVEKFRADPEKYLRGEIERHEPQLVTLGAPPRPSPPPASDVTYTCPMHPEIVRKGPGSCPICGMALEPVTPTIAD